MNILRLRYGEHPGWNIATDILKCVDITVGGIAGVALTVHFIGIVVIIGIPIGMFLAASGN